MLDQQLFLQNFILSVLQNIAYGLLVGYIISRYSQIFKTYSLQYVFYYTFTVIGNLFEHKKMTNMWLFQTQSYLNPHDRTNAEPCQCRCYTTNF